MVDLRHLVHLLDYCRMLCRKLMLAAGVTSDLSCVMCAMGKLCQSRAYIASRISISESLTVGMSEGRQIATLSLKSVFFKNIYKKEVATCMFGPSDPMFQAASSSPCL